MIKGLLRQLYDTFHIRNILRAISILEDRWRDSDNNSDMSDDDASLRKISHALQSIEVQD